MPQADSVFRARSDGISAKGVRDQYADGKAAKVWEIFIGDKSSRSDNYRPFLSKLTSDIKTSVLYIEGQPYLVTLDYLINIGNDISEFRLSYYPHRLEVFKRMLKDVFGETTKHKIY